MGKRKYTPSAHETNKKQLFDGYVSDKGSVDWTLSNLDI